MHGNGYLWTSSEISDSSIQFLGPDFLIECWISAIWRRCCAFLRRIFWKSTIFFPVYLTHWPRKCITLFTPHDDDSHQVWRCCSHPLSSYSVLAADILRDLDLWTFDLGHWSFMASHVSYYCTPLSYPFMSWLMTFPIGYHWKCIRSHCTCAVSRDLCIGVKNNYIFLIPGLCLPTLCNFRGATMTIKGRLHAGALPLGSFWPNISKTCWHMAQKW